MTFTSYIDLKTETEILYSKDKKIVAVFEKGKLRKVSERLCFAPIAGYYLSRNEGYTDNLVEPYSDDLNIGRVCKNRREYLRQFEDLKYHTLETSIFHNPYKEKEWRIQYNSQIEFLEKRGLWWLLDKKSVMELNKKDLISYVKKFGEYYNVRDCLFAFKKGFNSLEEYEKSRDLKKVEKQLKLSKKDAKYFIKKYCTNSYRLVNDAIKQYKDILEIGKQLNIESIGFPADLGEYEQKLIELKEIKDIKMISNKKIKALKNINIVLTTKSTKNIYQLELLNTPRRIKEIAIEFHNCIYTNYLKKIKDGDYIIGLIKKDNNDYACVGFKNDKLDQLYCKFNNHLPELEFNRLKRSLRIERV